MSTPGPPAISLEELGLLQRLRLCILSGLFFVDELFTIRVPHDIPFRAVNVLDRRRLASLYYSLSVWLTNLTDLGLIPLFLSDQPLDKAVDPKKFRKLLRRLQEKLDDGWPTGMLLPYSPHQDVEVLTFSHIRQVYRIVLDKSFLAELMTHGPVVRRYETYVLQGAKEFETIFSISIKKNYGNIKFDPIPSGLTPENCHTFLTITPELSKLMRPQNLSKIPTFGSAYTDNQIIDLLISGPSAPKIPRLDTSAPKVSPVFEIASLNTLHRIDTTASVIKDQISDLQTSELNLTTLLKQVQHNLSKTIYEACDRVIRKTEENTSRRIGSLEAKINCIYNKHESTLLAEEHEIIDPLEDEVELIDPEAQTSQSEAKE